MDRFGPGHITGAADGDPSGIATYSQAGAQLRGQDALDDAVSLSADVRDANDQRQDWTRRRAWACRNHAPALSLLGRPTGTAICPFMDLSATVKRAVISRLVDKFSQANANRCSTSEKAR
ncbi:conserved hypothetical protein [Sinorhizobium medicae]|uniref:Uncharacterized protein n=1 Tax=Sinorhizobium medicae TaxID=110321 RepID=A0A508WRC7_9HYPH|nr:conserved hypothetical protein [Sinorhizobium medicae]